MEDFTFFNKANEEENWISVSDMMAGLMMVFLFIAISYMIQINKEKDKAISVAVKGKAEIKQHSFCNFLQWTNPRSSGFR